MVEHFLQIQRTHVEWMAELPWILTHSVQGLGVLLFHDEDDNQTVPLESEV